MKEEQPKPSKFQLPLIAVLGITVLLFGGTTIFLYAVNKEAKEELEEKNKPSTARNTTAVSATPTPLPTLSAEDIDLQLKVGKTYFPQCNGNTYALTAKTSYDGAIQGYTMHEMAGMSPHPATKKVESPAIEKNELEVYTGQISFVISTEIKPTYRKTDEVKSKSLLQFKKGTYQDFFSTFCC